jgi:hypothetical protein
MTGAPTRVDDSQLEELGVRLTDQALLRQEEADDS